MNIKRSSIRPAASLSQLKLQPQQVGVEATFPLAQLVVGALLHDAAPVDDQDFVHFPNRAQAVGDDAAGAVLHELIHGALYQLLALRVEGRRGFVEDEDGKPNNSFRYGEEFPNAVVDVDSRGR